jgi:PAS domain S-box-containing protein
LRPDAKWLLAAILTLSLYHSSSNVVEWLGITEIFDPFEDFVEILTPVLWGVFVYAVLREGVERDLRESEARFRSLFKHLPDGVVLLDPHDPELFLPIVDCNEAFCRMNGYSRNELIGQSIDILHEQAEDRDRQLAHLEQMLRKGTIEGEAVHRRKDGSAFPVHHLTRQVTLEGRDLILGIDRDITAQVEAEALLRRAHGELEKRVEERTAELRQEIAERLRAEEELEAYHDHLEQLVEERTADHLRVNRELLALHSASLAIASSLDPQHVLNTVTREMVTLLGVESCYFSDWDRETDTVSEIAAYAPSGWRGDAPEPDVYDLADFPVTKQVLVEQRAMQLTISQPDIHPTELAYMKGAKLKTLMMLPMVFQDQTIGLVDIEDSRVERTFTDHEISLAQALANQATLTVHNARLFDQAQREIVERQRAEAEREVLISELEAKNTELERFTYTVSHDLKSPLITIQGFLGFLKQDFLAGDIERMEADFARISNAAGTMHQLLDELLELSRIRRILRPPERVPMGELARAAVDIVAGRLADRGIEVEIGPDLPVVYGDRARLRQVLENLVDNAVKFLGDQPAPRVTIGVRGGGDQSKELVFYVQDNGKGLDPRYQDKIFGLFEKLDPTTEGTGVGLAIVQRIIEVHGGRVWAESDGIGKGSTFCFTVPGHHEAIDEEH